MVDISCKERTGGSFFKVTKHIDRLAPSHQAVLFDGPLIHAYLPCGNTCYRKNGQSWVFPSCQAEVARCLRKVLQTGSFSGHSTPPHYPGRCLCLLQENGLLGPAVKQEDGKWGSMVNSSTYFCKWQCSCQQEMVHGEKTQTSKYQKIPRILFLAASMPKNDYSEAELSWISIGKERPL